MYKQKYQYRLHCVKGREVCSHCRSVLLMCLLTYNHWSLEPSKPGNLEERSIELLRAIVKISCCRLPFLLGSWWLPQPHARTLPCIRTLSEGWARGSMSELSLGTIIRIHRCMGVWESKTSVRQISFCMQPWRGLNESCSTELACILRKGRPQSNTRSWLASHRNRGFDSGITEHTTHSGGKIRSITALGRQQDTCTDLLPTDTYMWCITPRKECEWCAAYSHQRSGCRCTADGTLKSNYSWCDRVCWRGANHSTRKAIQLTAHSELLGRMV